jgi:pimeloyl-ACP methyl ester carboxylesterase
LGIEAHFYGNAKITAMDGVKSTQDMVSYAHGYTPQYVVFLIVWGTFNSILQIRFPPYPTSDYIDVYCQNRGGAPQEVYLNDPNFRTKADTSKPFVFLLHGWMDTVNQPFVVEGAKNFLENEDVTVCWPNYDFLTVVTITRVNTTQIGIYMAEYLNFVSTAVPLNRITLVAHSAGCEISGIAGNLLGGRLGQIIALDPVDSPDDNVHHLQRGDAQFVQSIITTRGLIATGSPDADQIFYPNDGTIVQPGCTEPLFCSHLRAIDYFVSSLNPANEFIGRRCIIPGQCENILDRLGFRSGRNQGTFFLRTAGEPPYALGIGGS